MSQDELQKFINLISRLPGIGQRSAQRIALYLMKNKQELMLPLGESIKETASVVKKCTNCGILDVIVPCKICSSENRSKTTICIVEDMADVWAFERSGYHKGLYHVLGGLLSPLDGIGPNDLNINTLIERTNEGDEVIIATNSSIEGEATSIYLNNILSKNSVTVTKLARGLPVGGDIDYLDEATLLQAIEGRTSI